MASTSTQLLDRASLPFGSNSCKYDVFLSFRGTDTRNDFVDHLYSALHEKVIFTFKDDLRLERGESISPAILNAIEESRLAVVVFSENYASSKWCLEELVKILECQKKRALTVLPVFYKVDPSDFRHQRGSVGEAFAQHERDSSEEKVQRWRNALTEAAGISGWDSETQRMRVLRPGRVQLQLPGLFGLPDLFGLQLRGLEFLSVVGLTDLDLSGCNFSEGFLPNDLGSLSSLESLCLSGTNIINLPISIRDLYELQYLDLRNCKKLNTLPYLSTNTIIAVNGCTSLETLTDPAIFPRQFDGSFTNCHTQIKNRPSRLLEFFRNILKNNKESHIVVPVREIPKYVGSPAEARLVSKAQRFCCMCCF